MIRFSTPPASAIVESLGVAVVIGTKKLSTIRKQIETALAPTDADPIQCREQQIASAKREGERTEVLDGLKRFLASPRKRQRRKPGVGAKT